MNVAIFPHGTTIMHRSALGRTREERVSEFTKVAAEPLLV
jgi:hypothetical protein